MKIVYWSLLILINFSSVTVSFETSTSSTDSENLKPFSKFNLVKEKWFQNNYLFINFFFFNYCHRLNRSLFNIYELC